MGLLLPLIIVGGLLALSSGPKRQGNRDDLYVDGAAWPDNLYPDGADFQVEFGIEVEIGGNVRQNEVNYILDELMPFAVENPNMDFDVMRWPEDEGVVVIGYYAGTNIAFEGTIGDFQQNLEYAITYAHMGVDVS